MGLILGLIAAFIVGAALVELGFTDPDLELSSRIFSIICGIIMMLPGMIMVPPAWSDYRKKKKAGDKNHKRNLFWFLDFQKKVPITEEMCDREQNINDFRRAFRKFFEAERLEENTDLQNEVTQLYWNILALQKRKLDKKKITMVFDSNRYRFGNYPDYAEKSYSDGKYDITEVTETFEAKKIFYKDGKRIGCDKCSKLVNMTIINPKANKKGVVFCQNCGAESTRENLIDGCDYCGAKYLVEDFGEKVSGFSFANDYDLAYSQYQDARSRFSLWISLLVGIPVFIITIIVGIVGAFNGAAEGSGPIMTIAAILISSAFLTFATVYFSLLFFYFLIFPGIQLLASLLHLIGENLEALKKAKETDPEIESKIRDNDPLFSRVGFYTNLQNMLATIFMGTNDDEMLAFIEGDDVTQEILSNKDSFSDIINVSTDWLRISSYGINNDMSQIIVEGFFTFIKEQNGHIKRDKHHIRLQTSREAKCLTNVVSGPSFYRCKGCGRTMNILSGKKCNYCGRIRNLTSMDWAITNFHMYND